MYVYERDQYSEKYRKGAGWPFWLAWFLVTTASTAVAQPLGDSIERAVPLGGVLSVPVLALSGALAGVIVGWAQGLVLLPYMKAEGCIEWVLATTLGRSARWVLVSIAMGLLAPIEFGGAAGFCAYWIVPIIAGGLAGTIVGIPQAKVLTRRVQRASWWVWANVMSSALYFFGLILVYGITYWFASPRGASLPSGVFESIFGGIVSGALTGAITGYVLVDLLRHPRSEAEWEVGWRRFRDNRQPRADDAQPSPEALLEQLRSTGNTTANGELGAAK